jgi:hypothetical protein
MAKIVNMGKVKYEVKAGAHIPSAKVQKYGKRLLELTKRYSGDLTRKQILADAEHPSSPLHDFFEWDDSVAAQKYRLEQAGYLIQSIVVTIKEHGMEDVRAFYNVTSNTEENGKRSVFVSLETVMSNSAVRRQVIAAAYVELIGWKERYK